MRCCAGALNALDAQDDTEQAPDAEVIANPDNPDDITSASFPHFTPAPVPSDFTYFLLECTQPDGHNSTILDGLNY